LIYPIYLDFNATTPVDPRVMEVMLPYFTEHFGNAASRSHAYGWVAEEAVDLAREQVASLIGGAKSEIIFTSGATESINLALQGLFQTYGIKGHHFISAPTEHKAVIDTLKHLETHGAEITWLSVDRKGRINLDELNSAIRDDTVGVCLMYANNETGLIHPVREIGAICKQREVIFCCDATQAVGKVPIDVQLDGIDLLACSAHKIYGPKGVGALYVRRRDPRVKLSPLQFGGGHEKGLRSGTLNVPGIVGFGKACALYSQFEVQEFEVHRKLRDHLQAELLTVSGTVLNSDPVNCLPHVANIGFGGVEGTVFVSRLAKHVAISTGSACTSATLEPSYVLKAMGLDDQLAGASVRFSLGRITTEEDINMAIEVVRRIYRETKNSL
jgi:cysteine desulfurase